MCSGISFDFGNTVRWTWTGSRCAASYHVIIRMDGSIISSEIVTVEEYTLQLPNVNTTISIEVIPRNSLQNNGSVVCTDRFHTTILCKYKNISTIYLC